MNTEQEKIELQPKKIGSPLQELASTITHGQLQDDEIQDLVTANWPKVVGIVVLAIAGVWIFEAIKSSKAKISGESSARYSTVQESFQTVYLNKESAEALANPADTVSRPQTALVESAKSIVDTGNVKIYSNLSEGYLAANDLLQKNPQGAASRIKPLVPERLFLERQGFAPARLAKEEDLSGELSALLYVRALYESEDAQYRSLAERLVRNSVFIAPETLVFLARTSATTEERTKVQSLGEELGQSRPELREIVRAGLSPFGLTGKISDAPAMNEGEG